MNHYYESKSLPDGIVKPALCDTTIPAYIPNQTTLPSHDFAAPILSL